MKNGIKKLEWDSAFFNMNVYCISNNIITNYEMEGVIKELQEHEIDLAYYSSLQPLNKLQNISEMYDIILVDKKTTYKKSVSGNVSFHDSVTLYKENYPDEKLFELAIQSGIYSRFNVDKKIGKINFEKLYKQWIINSVNKIIADEVLVYNINNSIAGFITLGEKNSIGDIGIIAVDSKFRGKGIGKSLIYSAEKWFANNNYSEIQVVTQGNNLPACRLYENCGFQSIRVEYFYHIWKKKRTGI